LDVSKAIDKHHGATRDIVGTKRSGIARVARNGGEIIGSCSFETAKRVPISTPSTDDARALEGWGTALKPALEPIVLARKPLSEETVAANVLKWGTGAINIDGCRIECEPISTSRNIALGSSSGGIYGAAVSPSEFQNHPRGRWPANVILDGSDEVVSLFPVTKSGALTAEHQDNGDFAHPTAFHAGSSRGGTNEYEPNSGSAARFFYHAKANSADRAQSKHVTVKPVDLMRYLIRLVTPKDGIVLDCFAGSGTTGEAAYREGFRSILIEREAEYLTDIERRIAMMQSPMQPRKQRRSSAPMPLLD
jgi:site-specific DNA-methyltransferase (adenine-specific)